MRGLALLAALSLLACPPTSRDDGRSVKAVAQVATTMAAPAYLALAERARALAETSATFAATPDAGTLAAMKSDWAQTRLALRKTDAVGFGPLEDLRISSAIDYWPANGEGLEALMAGTNAIDATVVAESGANLKGLSALEQLLFSADGGDTLGTLAAQPRRRALVAALASVVASDAARLDAAWRGDGGYAHALAAPGVGNTAFPSAKAAIDTVVNQSYFVGDLAANGVIGRPFGKRNGGVLEPLSERSTRSGNTLAEIRASLTSMKSVYDNGLGELLASRNADADARVRRLFDEAFKRVDEVPEPFSQSMTTHASQVEAMYQAVRDLKNEYGADVSTMLGVTLRFSDNDGD